MLAPWGSPHPTPGPPAITLPQPAAATARSQNAPPGSSPAPGVRCSLGPMQPLTGDGGDGGRLALPAASQAGDADVVAPAWLQPPQVIGAGSGWELLAALGPPWPGGERGEGAAAWGLAGMRGRWLAKLTLSQAPDQAVPGAAGHRHPGQAQAVLRGLCHLEAADGGQRGCLRCGAEERALGAGVPGAAPGCCPPPSTHGW